MMVPFLIVAGPFAAWLSIDYLMDQHRRRMLRWLDRVRDQAIRQIAITSPEDANRFRLLADIGDTGEAFEIMRRHGVVVK